MAKRKSKPSARTLSRRAKKGWVTRRAREEFERESALYLERALKRQERAEAKARALEAERRFLGIPPEEPKRITPKGARARLPVEREGVEAPPASTVVLYTRATIPRSDDEETGEVDDFFFQTVLPALHAGGTLDASSKLAPYIGKEMTFLIAGTATANIRGTQITKPFNLARVIRGESLGNYLKALGGIVRDLAKITNQENGGDMLGSPWTYFVNYVAFIPPN